MVPLMRTQALLVHGYTHIVKPKTVQRQLSWIPREPNKNPGLSLWDQLFSVAKDSPSNKKARELFQEKFDDVQKKEALFSDPNSNRKVLKKEINEGYKDLANQINVEYSKTKLQQNILRKLEEVSKIQDEYILKLAKKQEEIEKLKIELGNTNVYGEEVAIEGELKRAEEKKEKFKAILPQNTKNFFLYINAMAKLEELSIHQIIEEAIDLKNPETIGIPKGTSAWGDVNFEFYKEKGKDFFKSSLASKIKDWMWALIATGAFVSTKLVDEWLDSGNKAAREEFEDYRKAERNTLRQYEDSYSDLKATYNSLDDPPDHLKAKMKELESYLKNEVGKWRTDLYESVDPNSKLPAMDIKKRQLETESNEVSDTLDTFIREAQVITNVFASVDKIIDTDLKIQSITSLNQRQKAVIDHIKAPLKELVTQANNATTTTEEYKQIENELSIIKKGLSKFKKKLSLNPAKEEE